MNLNIVGFGTLMSYIGRMVESQLSNHAVEHVAALVEECLPKQEPVKANAGEIDEMLKAIREGKKIDAIKWYRSLTGYGLKESKEAIERYWIDGKTAALDMRKSMAERVFDPQIFHHTDKPILAEFTDDQKQVIKSYIESFYP